MSCPILDLRNLERPHRSGVLAVLIAYAVLFGYGTVNGNHDVNGKFSTREEPLKQYHATLIYCPTCKVVKKEPEDCTCHLDLKTHGIPGDAAIVMHIHLTDANGYRGGQDPKCGSVMPDDALWRYNDMPARGHENTDYRWHCVGPHGIDSAREIYGYVDDGPRIVGYVVSPQ